MLDKFTITGPNKLFVLLIAILLSVGFLSGCIDNNDDHESNVETITLGVLLPLTGARASRGIAEYEALNISLEDIKEYIASMSPGTETDNEIEIELLVEDTQTSPDVALEKLKALDEKGVTMVLGPHSSGETAAVKDYADENDILIISLGSTSPGLSVAGDNIFRMAPDATAEAHALATLIDDDGIDVLVPILRDDVWANGMLNATKEEFISRGGEVAAEIKYDTSTTNFSASVTSLETKIDEALKHHETRKVAVAIFSFDEVTEIFELAKDSNALGSVRWYGGDGISKNPGIVADHDLAAFAIKTQLQSSCYGLDESAKQKRDPVADRISQNPKADANIYAFATYDALWLATLSYLEVIGADTKGSEPTMETLKTVFPTVAKNYFGITGWTLLNAAGDRSFGNYDFWGVEKSDTGEFSWDVFARYVPGPDFQGMVVKDRELMKPYEGKKVLFINSYHEGYEWSDGIYQGILSSLQGTGVELKVFYMDTKRNPDEEYINQSAQEAKAVIDFYEPDVVIAADDNAFKYLIMPFYADAELPFAFCGINWGISEYPGAPYDNTAGMIEVAPTADLVNSLKGYAGGDRIGYLSIDRLTMNKEVEHFETLYNLTEKSLVNNFSAWKDSFLAMQNDVDMLVLGNTVGMDDWNDDEAETFVRANVKIPVGTSWDWIMPYSMLGFTTVPEEQGEAAAQMALQILSGTAPSDIPLEYNDEVNIYVNTWMADELGITIDQELLDQAIIVD